MKSEWKDIFYDISTNNDTRYGQWNNYAIKLWYDGMTNFSKKGN